MLKFFSLAVLFLIVSGKTIHRHRFQVNQAKYVNDSESLRGRIVGGRDSTIEEFPYQVALFYRRSPICGGSVLNHNTILSAAHCTHGYRATDHFVLAGQTDITQTSSLVQVLWAEEHPAYDDWQLWNDVVVIRLAQNLIFSDAIRSSILPTPNFNVYPGRIAVLSGWGDLEYRSRNYPDILQSVEVPIVSNEECQEIYGDDEEILDQHICAGEPGNSCQGDSGGPLVYNNIQIGIISWGYGCAEEWPGVNVRVSEYLAFITQQMSRE